MNGNRSEAHDAADPARTGLQLVEKLGAHPASALGIDLDEGGDRELSRWLVASILLAGRTPEEAALRAFRRLDKEGLTSADSVARAGAAALELCLEELRLPNLPATAARLTRVCRSLAERHAGSLERAVAGAGDLEDLARRLASLAPGFGRAGVMRFLTPLREHWSAAADLAATPAVCAAARDLGLVSAQQDEEGTPACLRRWLAGASAPAACERTDLRVPALRDLEAALDRLGRAACLRERSDRCPLAETCPRRAEAERGAAAQ